MARARIEVLPALPSRKRERSTIVKTVVLHSTVTQTAPEAIEILRERELSYHFVIERDGAVFVCVPPTEVAFHAGDSLGPQGPSANEYSVGISFVNMNDGIDPYGEAQLAAVETLLIELRSNIPTLEWLTTHASIAPQRKNDPVGCPIVRLATAAGLTVWPEQLTPVATV